MEQADITIIGAGIIGLAVGASMAGDARTIYVLEQNDSFGQETSSRNSEVIHAGIYYPKDSLKAKTCVQGNQLIYQICTENQINYKRLGKLIIACNAEEAKQLEHLLQNGRDNGVSDLVILRKQEILKLEPNVRALAALYSPNTGIVDSHNLMRYFLQKAKSRGAEFVFKTTVTAIDRKDGNYMVSIRDSDGSSFSFSTRILINCAGLNSDVMAEYAGINIREANYILKFCKGQYFRVASDKSGLVRHLVYPVPDKTGVSLGIHVTPDLGGGLRLGPDAQYIQKAQAEYNIDDTKKQAFSDAVNSFLPFISAGDLCADTAGIRPKLQGPDNDFCDFVIRDEAQRGLPGLINLIGIDSPGLTAAPAIGRYVAEMIE